MFYYLYELLYTEDSIFSFLRLFKYITFRSLCAVITSSLIWFVFGRSAINFLFKRGMRDIERDYGLIQTGSKRGTPTMGGVIIVISTLISALLWCDLSSSLIWIILASFLYFAVLGGIDDFYKVKYKNSDKGLSRGQKYIFQFLFGIILAVLCLWDVTSPIPPELQTKLYIPFYKHPILDLGFFQGLFIAIMIVYAANAVNFADGMDGLAIVPSIFVLLVYGLLAYVMGHAIFSKYLFFEFFKGSSEITIFCAALVGAGLGFLWYNSYPAELFMGDAGSMAIGGAIGSVVILLKQELLFFIVGGVFLAEILSVIWQDWLGIQILGRRLMYRAPLHHTFEHHGIAETKVVVRFWIVSAILAMIGLISFKVR